MFDNEKALFAQEELKKFVMDHDMLTEEQVVSHFLNEGVENPVKVLETHIHNSELIALPGQFTLLFPAFQFFTENEDIVYSVNRVLIALDNPLTAADWWFRPSVNSWIPPYLMINASPDEVAYLAIKTVD